MIEGDVGLSETELYKELGELTKNEAKWEEKIPYVSSLLDHDSMKIQAKVRLAFIWASENIATNKPGIYEGYMQVFEKLLHDANERVRMEAPEMFRVLGKRKPELVKPYLGLLKEISETDDNRVVRVHCLGAIKATEPK